MPGSIGTLNTQFAWSREYKAWHDFVQVLDLLREANYPFKDEWFAPFHDFRFPRYGEIQLADISLELRSAIEPWHVLGEETRGQGTSRFVASPVERLQAKLTGLSSERHGLLCNGCRVPLRATATRGKHVTGIRYKAWAPPSALHPTIGVATPLITSVALPRKFIAIGPIKRLIGLA